VARAYVGLGTSIDPAINAMLAVEHLAARVEVTGVSTLYRTPALHKPDDPDFVNGAVALRTDLEPPELKRSVLRELEDRRGRTRSGDPYAPRTLDLDLLLHGDRTLDTPELTLPDPELYERRFVAEPLLEVAGDVRLPGDGRRLAEVVDALDPGGMLPLAGLTGVVRARLRRARERGAG